MFAGGATSYVWSPTTNVVGGNTSTPTFTPTVPGLTNFTVTGTGPGGCTATATVSVTVTAPPSVVLTPGFAPDTSITVAVAANTGTPPFDVQIVGSTTQTVTGVNLPYTFDNLSEGIYVVTVTDANGCTDSEPITINSASCNLGVNVTASATTVCVGDEVTLTVNAINGTGTETILWGAENGTFIPNPDAQTVTVTITSSTLFDVTLVQGPLCSAVGTITITANAPPPAPVITGAGEVCEGGAVEWTAVSVGATGYTWTGPNNFTANSPVLNLTNVTFADAGEYTCVPDNAGCAGPAITKTLTVKPAPAPPTLTANGPCKGETLILRAQHANPAATFRWEGPNDFIAEVANPTILSTDLGNAGTYLCYAIAEGCTSVAATVEVEIYERPNKPTLNAQPDPICAGETLKLFAQSSAGVQYYWTGPNGFVSDEQNPEIANVTTAYDGTYTVVAYAGTCTSEAASRTVRVREAPFNVIAARGGTVCLGAGGKITVFATNPAYTYALIHGTDAVGSPQTGNAAELDFPVPATILNAAGEFVFNVRITDRVTGCSSFSNPVTITVVTEPAAPKVKITPPRCEGDVAIVEIDTPYTASSYLLYTTAAGGTGFETPTRFLVGPLFGDTTLFVSAYTPGCAESERTAVSLGVDAQPKAIISALPDPSQILIAPGKSTVQFRNLSINAPFSRWDFGDGNYSNERHPSHTYTTPGVYQAILTVYSPNGCIDSTSVKFTVHLGEMIEIPNVISANFDGMNDGFYVKHYGYKHYCVKIFDRWGQMMFDNQCDVTKIWFGTTPDGAYAHEGTYFYILNAYTENGREDFYKGNVTVIR
jgi:PKD repeat protein